MSMGQMQESVAGSDFNAHAFLVQQMLGRINTATLVKVVAVHNPSSATSMQPVGLVDIQPLVHQVDGLGKNSVPHGVLHNIPYFRLQGGINAVVIDPQVGDLGIAVFASRDISKVKNTKKANPPGSFRQYSMSDGLYIGGFLNAAPTQWIYFDPNGKDIYVQTQTLHVSGKIIAQGDVIGNGISLDNHTHVGVQPGSGNTGKPQ